MGLFVLTSLCLVPAEAGEPVLVTLETSLGNIVIALDEEKAPLTSANFIRYVKDGFYDGTVFHRVMDGFMIQGGGFDVNMKEKKTFEPVRNEADNGLKNERYSVAMARTDDPHSATSQFFINVKDNEFLDHRAKNPRDWGYCVFGKVVEGREVVDKIKAVPTRTRGYHENVPTVPALIKKAYLR
ncbi:MAG: peptidyl-prolyl cis-trans isomerase [Deltaproteobacteria bacterium]|nr:peptidyl-prolyl cis-trans isomerase [Deltaproteobacteria bacterium]